MSLEKIVSIPGKSGLFKMVAQMRNGGYVIESLADQKRFPVDAMHRVVMLKDITVYTVEGDMPLKEVFLKMKDHDADASKISSKSDGAELKTTFKKIVPNFDEERVHTSDIRKMISWYTLLKDIVDFNEEEVKEEVTADAVESTPVESEKEVAKPKAKTPKAKKVDTEKTAVEKPAAKKKAAKKTAS